MFQVLIGSLVTCRQHWCTCERGTFQVLIGSLVTLLLKSAYRRWKAFQVLIGSLVTKNRPNPFPVLLPSFKSL